MQQVDYSTKRFKTSQVAEASGIAPDTLRSYFKRGQFRIIGKQAAGEGLPHLFSLRDAMVFAVAAKLIEVGEDPLTAFHVAVQDFGHFGTEERHPTRLFDVGKYGLTVMLYWPNTKRAALKGSKEITGLADLIFSPSHGSQDVATIIVLNPVEQRVFTMLGVS